MAAAVMEIYLIFLVVLLGVAAGDDICPAPSDIKPCTCDREGVNCMLSATLEDIKRAFSANFKYGATRGVWILSTPITSLPADTFGTVESEAFYVEINSLTSVDLNAFRASKETMTLLSLFGNQLVDFPFNQLSDFQALSKLNLAKNQIETIPHNAFNSKSLYSINLAQNQIKTVGANAFANLPALERLEMSQNQIVTLGPMSMAMKAEGDLQINLSSNRISEIASNAFQGTDLQAIYFSRNKLTSLKKEPFEDLVTKAAGRGGYVEVSGNPLSCQGCDYSWIILNKDLLSSKLKGFSCMDGKPLQHLTKDDIGCH